MHQQSATPPIDIAAPEIPKPKEKKRHWEFFGQALKYFLWPQWLQKYSVYKEWAAGNDDRLHLARKKFWIAVAVAFVISIAWWARLAHLSEWSISSSLDMVRFVIFSWASACLPLNIYCVGIGNRLGTFSVPDWKKYLTSNTRLHWVEFPSPDEKKFALGTDGRNWIWYGWYSGAVEYIKTGRIIFGDPKYDPENALRYLMLCAASDKTIFVCLDGDPFGGVGFRHLKNVSNCLIYVSKENIIRAVRWLHKEMGKRRDGDEHPRIVIVCDQRMMDVYADGWWSEKEKSMHYHWYEIRREMIDILKHGSRFNIFVIGIVEPSDRFTSLHNDMMPHMLAISLFYYQPVTNEKGTVWVEPHPNHYVDVFSIIEGNDRVIGKMPYLPESEQVEWLLRLSENLDESTDTLKATAKHEIKNMKIEQSENKEEEKLPLWRRIGMRKGPIEIKPSDDPIDLGAQEEFHRLHHEPKNGHPVGIEKSNGRQVEMEVEET